MKYLKLFMCSKSWILLLQNMGLSREILILNFRSQIAASKQHVDAMIGVVFFLILRIQQLNPYRERNEELLLSMGTVPWSREQTKLMLTLYGGALLLLKCKIFIFVDMQTDPKRIKHESAVHNQVVLCYLHRSTSIYFHANAIRFVSRVWVICIHWTRGRSIWSHFMFACPE